MSVSVKEQDVSDLNETQKNLYDTLLASQAEQADQIYEASADEDGTQTEEVDDTTLDAAKQSSEDQSVVTSDGTAVENNNSDTKSSTVTNYLFDVTLKHGDKAVEPTGEVQVSIQSDLFKSTDSDLSIIHLDEVKNEAVDTEAVINTDEGTAVLTMDSFSAFVIEGENQKIYDSLFDAFNQAPDGATIKLDSNYDENVLKEKTFTIDKNLTLDLNGHFLHFNEIGSSAPFTISKGKTFTIKDSSAEGDNPKEIDTVSDETVNTNYDNAANNELKDNTDTVTYYVTQSSTSGTTTTESTKKHVYSTKGYIVGDIKKGRSTGIVYVSSGATFNLQSGLLTAHTNYDNGYDDGHSVFNCGIFNMTGGYIVGRKSNQKGAGICATSGSTTNLSGGVIAATTTTDGGAGVYVDNASLNLNGTIISGNQSNSRGGGIYGESATITISHLETNSSIYGVVTNNSSKESSSYYGGGGIYAHNGTLNIYDGVISRNYVDESNGGGIFADGCATTVTGGHISYNYAHTSIENTGTGFYGGGGIATVGSSLTISGGTVDHNTSSWGGGGIMVGSYDGNEWVGTEFKLTGGSISDNTAGGEGGGLRISQKSTDCIIEGSANNRVYIKNNKCETTKDWGGGGIFIQEGGKLSIYNAKITANKAGVYGGGVASCPSGSTVLNMANVALYANEAEGYKERTSHT